MTGLAGKIILITGAGAGIGAATARRALAEGARLICTDLDPAAEDRLALPSGQDTLFLPHDVSSPDDWSRVEAVIADKFGRLDGLVNNAGLLKMGTIESTTLEDYRSVLAVNLDGTLLGCQAGLRLMKENGGSIVNLASIAAEKPGPGSIAYGISKAGIVNLTKSVAAYCQKKDYTIRCNAVSPGAVDTQMRDLVFGDRPADKASASLPKHVAAPADIAEGILFLLSPRAAYVTGSVFLMDGGRLL